MDRKGIISKVNLYHGWGWIGRVSFVSEFIPWMGVDRKGIIPKVNLYHGWGWIGRVYSRK